MANPFAPKPKRPFCHRMSGFLFKARSPLEIGAEAHEPAQQMVMCLGPECAAWIADVSGEGHITGRGMCADTLQAAALSTIAASIAEFVASEDEEEIAPPGKGN